MYTLSCAQARLLLPVAEEQVANMMPDMSRCAPLFKGPSQNALLCQMIASIEKNAPSNNSSKAEQDLYPETSMVSDSFTLVSVVSTPIRSNTWSVEPLSVLFPSKTTLMLLY